MKPSHFRNPTVISLPALQVHQLTVNYGKTLVLWDISLEVPQGKLIASLVPMEQAKAHLLRLS